MLDVPWTVLEETQLKPLPHKLAASTGWFFSMGSEANNDAVAIATKAKIEIFFYSVVHVTHNAEIFYIRNSLNSVITRFLAFFSFLSDE